MATVLEPAVLNAEELAQRFGPIPMSRIVNPPVPGLAT
jgi:hypothetical protein